MRNQIVVQSTLQSAVIVILPSFSAEPDRVKIAGVRLSHVLPSPVEKNDSVPHTDGTNKHPLVKKTFTYLVLFKLAISGSKS